MFLFAIPESFIYLAIIGYLILVLFLLRALARKFKQGAIPLFKFIVLLIILLFIPILGPFIVWILLNS